MSCKPVHIKTKDGETTCQFCLPPDNQKRPAVIMYMDAFGVRPALIEMAERLASSGFCVLLPDLYYRAGPVKPFDPATGFTQSSERERLTPLFRSLTHKLVMEDTGSFLEFLKNDPAVAGSKVGCVGYCMGGGFALSAAGTFPDRITAAASLHGSRLANDQPDSPHLLAPKMRAEIYVGIAGLDVHFTSEEKQRLESVLQSAGVEHAIEVYPNVKHGFAVNDTPVFDRQASEHHWERIVDLFDRNIS